MGQFLSKRRHEVEGERSRCQKCNQHEELEELRSALRVKENDLKSAKERLVSTESFYKQELSTMTTQRDSQHRHYKEELKKNRSAWNKERQRCLELEAFYKHELNKEILQRQTLLLSSRCQQCEQQENEHKQKLSEMEIFYKDKLNKERTALKQNQDELTSFKERFSEMELFYKQELNKEKSLLKQKEDELTSIKSRLQSQSLLRSRCHQCEQQENEHKQTLSEMEIFYKDKLNKERSALKQKQEELLSFKERFAADKKSGCRRCEQHEHEHKKRMTEMETFYKKKLQQARSDLEQKEQDLNALKLKSRTEEVKSKCQACERHDREHKQSLNEQMAFYKEKLYKTESALKQREEELKSFKHRVAANMSVSIKTSNTENMNNPVSKTRLTEMYDNLKLLQWPKVKDQLKFRKMNPKEAKDLIQKIFAAASEEMKRKKQHMEAAFGLTESSSGLTFQKVKEYKQLTVQNLQMALFHSNKEELLKIGFSQLGGPNSEEVMENLRPLTSECYWLSCLMALNNPPLQPDWKNHVPSMDPWDIFPRDIKPYAAV